jgi:hypothetical protein
MVQIDHFDFGNEEMIQSTGSIHARHSTITQLYIYMRVCEREAMVLREAQNLLCFASVSQI